MRDWWIFRGLCLSPDVVSGGAGASGDPSPGGETPASAATPPPAAAQPPTSSSTPPASGSSPSASSGVDMAAVRDLVLAAHADVVPEMIAGESFDELMASVGPAQAAYKRIVDSVRTSQPPSVPAGGAPRTFTINVEELSPAAKIAEGLRQRNARSS